MNLYSIFHANLQFSSIPEEHHKYIIESCYWPVLELNKKYPVKCGLEFSGYTLERINELDSSFIHELKHLVNEKKIEIIGSSYSQTIFPLIPAIVNQKNIEIGNKIYKKFFNLIPGIFYLNEQVFSKGLIDLYLEKNIKTIVMDWDNTRLTGKLDDKYKYEVPFLSGIKNNNLIHVLWNSSISFQKLQHYLFDEITISDYITYLSRQLSASHDRCLLWYGSDMEIFDYKPGMLDVEYLLSPPLKTMGRLQKFIEVILENPLYSFELPGTIVRKYSTENELNIGFPEYPILCKKQAKYNVTRWAVCGRSNTFLNQECYKIFQKIQNLHMKNKENYWKKLNYLWGSDFRTFASDKKIIDFYKEIGNISSKLHVSLSSFTKTELNLKKLSAVTGDIVETDRVCIHLNFKKGLSVKKAFFKNISNKWLFGTISHDMYEDIRFSTDQYSAHFIAQDIYGTKFTDISHEVEHSVQLCSSHDRIHMFTKISFGKTLELYKSIYLYKTLSRLEVEYHFKFFDFQPQYLRMGIITINPEAFDLDSLYYATHNGGFDEEYYFLKGTKINQIQTIDNRITSSHCMGSTEDYLKIGDKDKEIKIILDRTHHYLVPLLHFEQIKNTYYFRVYHSMAETDETSKHLFRGHMKIKFIIDVTEK